MDKSCVHICFDDGHSINTEKELLIQHSVYVTAMFCGNFLDAYSENPINLEVFKFKTHTNLYTYLY